MNRKLLKIISFIYGILIVFISGSFLISLLIHDDLMLTNVFTDTLYYFDWIVGDVILLLVILWGILFAFSGFKKTFGFLCAFLAAVISLLSLLNRETESLAGYPWLGILFNLALFFLPSVMSIIIIRKLSFSQK